MLPQLTIEQDFNELGNVGRGFRREAKKLVRDFGREVIASAKPNAKVDTGAYRASLYFKTSNYSNYSKAASEGLALNEEGGVLPEIPSFSDELRIDFAIAMKYGYAVHEGLGPHEGSPNPILTEAIFENADKYVLAIGLALDRSFQNVLRSARKAKARL